MLTMKTHREGEAEVRYLYYHGIQVFNLEDVGGGWQ